MNLLQSTFSGMLDKSSVSGSLIEGTIDFIWDALLPWRNDPNRLIVEDENKLNEQLHDFLSARSDKDFPMVFFHHEQQQTGKRRVDIAVKPKNSVTIYGTQYTCYQPIIVIECKRLPAPSQNREREYVTGEREKISGGIQRFKLGEHGREHNIAIIVGYVQKKSLHDWFLIINGWIDALANTNSDLWSNEEKLTEFHSDSNKRAKSISIHSRRKECKSNTIQLFHFWIQMK
jgi:hypothetical protein